MLPKNSLCHREHPTVSMGGVAISLLGLLRRRRLLGVLLIVLSIFLSSQCFAEEDGSTIPPGCTSKSDKGDVPEQAKDECPGLDYRYRFSKKFVGELDIMGGNYLGDYSQNTWAAGGRGYLHINHIFAVGAEYLYTHLRADGTSSFGQVLRDKNQHIIDGQLMVTNEILFAAGKSNIPMDLYLTVGGGALRINKAWKWLAEIGGGVKVYLKPKWMALRVDVNSYIHPTPTVSGDQLSGDVSFLFGLAFFFPYRPPELPVSANVEN